MRTLNRVLMATVVSTFLSLSGVISAQAAPVVAEPDRGDNNEVVTIDHGHIDIFHATSTGKGNLVLQMADDTAGPRVLRTPESAILQVNADRWYKPEAVGEFAKIISNKPAAILPLAQENNSLWPGWDVMELNGKYQAVDIVFDEVIGPKGGQLFLVGGAQGLSSDFQDYMSQSPNTKKTKFQVLPGKFIRDKHLSHTHAYWAFTKPGIYQFKAHIREADPEKMKTAGCVKTRVATYSWRVLDSKGSLPNNFEMVNYGTPIVDKTCTKESTSGTEGNIIGSTIAPDKAILFGEGYLESIYKMIAKLQKDFLRINKQIADCRAGITCALNTGSSTRGDSGVSSGTSRNTGKSSSTFRTANTGAGVHVIPINTHVHPNWVFTAPGTYKIVIRQTARLKTGKIISADAPLTFYVGGTGNSNSGHFDLGADVRNGKFVALIRDDSHSPARYVSPSALTFGLGAASREKAPAGIGFIAARGSTIYRIPEVQKAGVPWLGANTMNPGVLANVVGGVSWSIISFRGPGQMAMFSGGGFDGKYRVWLNTRGIKKYSAGGSNITNLKAIEPGSFTPDSTVSPTDKDDTISGQPTLLSAKESLPGIKIGLSNSFTIAAIGILLGGTIILIAAIAILKARSRV